LQSCRAERSVAADALSTQFERVAKQATHAALEALRSVARRGDGTYDPDALFDELADGGAEILESKFNDFFARRRLDFALSSDKVRLALRRVAPHGLTRRVFVAALADFLKAIRDIAVTDEFEIQSAKKIRKLEAGEVLEALGASKTDNLGLERVQCRAIRDSTTGWVTVQSNAGSVYLEKTDKPFLWISQGVDMRERVDADSRRVRELKAGEVVELAEGPREERLGADMRVRGTTCNEDVSGWLQVQDKSGTVLAKPSNLIYRCVESIAMTDVADFAECTHVRRIDPGEALELLPEVKASEGEARRKFRACRDGKEGWITMKGSQGTTYLKAAPNHYVCQQASPVHAGLSAESAVVHVLMPGQAFSAVEQPKEVAGGDRLTIYRVRAVTDGAEGWVTSSMQDEVEDWHSRYKVLKAVALTRTLAANEAAEVIEVIRLLEPGETVDVA